MNFFLDVISNSDSHQFAIPVMFYPLLILFCTYPLSTFLLMLFYKHIWCLIRIPSAFDSSYYLLEQIRWMIIRPDDIMNLWIKKWWCFHAWNKEAQGKKRDKVWHNEIWALCETKLTVNAKECCWETLAKPSSHFVSVWMRVSTGWNGCTGWRCFLFGSFLGFFLNRRFVEVRLNVMFTRALHKRYIKLWLEEGEWKIWFSVSYWSYSLLTTFCRRGTIKYTFTQCSSTNWSFRS